MKPYIGKPYSPKQVRDLFIEETPEKFTQHSTAGRRTIADSDEGEQSRKRSAVAITPITQPEWSSPFWRLMSDDSEMAKGKNWWYFPVRRALVKLAEAPDDWGRRKRDRRALIVRAMRMYLFSNYDVRQIAAALGIKRHEAYRALEDASSQMTRWIGVFGQEFKAYDRQAFLEGVGR